MEKSLWRTRWLYLVGSALISIVMGAHSWNHPSLLILAFGGIANLALLPLLARDQDGRDITPLQVAGWGLDIAIPLVWSLTLPLPTEQWGIWILLYPVWVTSLRSDWFWGLLLAGGLLSGYSLQHFALASNIPMDIHGLTIFLKDQSAILFELALISALTAILAQVSHQTFGTEDTGTRASLEYDRREARALRDISKAMATSNSYHLQLHALAETTRHFLGDEKWSSLLLLFNDDTDRGELRVVTGSSYRQEDKNARLSSASGVLRQAILEGDPIVCTNPDESLKPLASLAGMNAIILIPLQSGLDEYGILVLASRNTVTVNQKTLAFLKTLCQMSSLTLHNVQLHQDLQKIHDGAISDGEVSRRQLARNLHDGPVQTVAAMSMQIEYIKALLQRIPAQVPGELDELYEMSRKASHSMRTLLFTLRPVVLETEGLSAALAQLVGRLREESNLDIHFVDHSENVRLRAEAEETAFAILEEAVNNARKHASDARIDVRLLVDGEFLIAQVEDNGPGFDVAATLENYHERASLGMLNMKERAALIEANWTIDSSPGKGALISLAIPIASHHRASDDSDNHE